MFLLKTTVGVNYTSTQLGEWFLMFKQCIKYLERLDPPFTNYQFKLNIKQYMCGK